MSGAPDPLGPPPVGIDATEYLLVAILSVLHASLSLQLAEATANDAVPENTLINARKIHEAASVAMVRCAEALDRG